MEINNSKLRTRMIEDFSNLAVIYAHILREKENCPESEVEIINKLLKPLFEILKNYTEYKKANSFSNTNWKKQEANFQKLINYSQGKIKYEEFLNS
ncbi:MAG: hypothetical protein J6B11_08025 [Spirochaetales bacterium]|nr:hypothetical protein [Spirochaetales bacterium]